MLSFLLVLLVVIFLFYAPSSGCATFIDKELIVKNSNIAGIGIFAKDSINSGDKIFNSIKNFKITRVGALINHSWTPNTTIKSTGIGSYDIYAKRYIRPNEEITLDYADSNMPSWVDGPDLKWK